MAFATITDVTPTAQGFSNTTASISLPATTVAGRLLLILLANNNSRTTSTPTGWTLVDTQVSGGGIRISIFAKIADGTEGGGTASSTIGGGFTNYIAQALQVSGFSGTISTDIDFGTIASGTATTTNPPLATAGWGSDDNLFVAISVRGGAISAQAISNYTNIGAVSGSSISIDSYSRDLAASSDNPPATSTYGASQAYVGQTIVIKPSTATVVTASAIASEEAVPSPSLKAGITAGGIDSEEAFGTALITMRVTAEAIASAEAVGEPTISPIQAITPGGIISEEALGTPAVTPADYTISPSSIESGEAIGEAVIGRAVFPSSIESLEGFGTPHIRKYVTFTGIESAEAFGAVQLNRSLMLTGISSTEAFGTTVITVGSVTITVSSIGTEEDFGEPLIIAATTSGFRRPPPGSARYIPTPSVGSARYAVRPPAGV